MKPKKNLTFLRREFHNQGIATKKTTDYIFLGSEKKKEKKINHYWQEEVVQL